MSSQTGILSVKEARQRILAEFSPLEKRQVDLNAARGYYLAEIIASPIDLPSFKNSSMDGFAVIADDIRLASQENPIQLQIVGDIPAGGYPAIAINSGESMRIMTGAPLPEGADAVVPVELTNLFDQSAEDGFPDTVNVYAPVKSGAYVRRIGEDIQSGKVVLDSGKLIRSQEIGFLAMLGIANVWVRRQPLIALLSTGDELLKLDEALSPGKIYDSNAYTLRALIENYGGQVVDLGIASDNKASVINHLDKAILEKADLIVSSAGVSVGAFDFVRKVIQDNGSLSFWRINMRPGKPLAFGNYSGIPFVGLPGNPVSAFVCFELFLRPAILKMLGSESFPALSLRVELTEPIQSDGRESYLRAIIWKENERYFARLAENQNSGNLYSLVVANAFLIVPSEVKSLPIGSEIDAWIIDEIR